MTETLPAPAPAIMRTGCCSSSNVDPRLTRLGDAACPGRVLLSMGLCMHNVSIPYSVPVPLLQAGRGCRAASNLLRWSGWVSAYPWFDVTFLSVWPRPKHQCCTTGLCQSATTNPAHPEAVNLAPISQCFRIAGYLVASEDRRSVYVRQWLSIHQPALCGGQLTLDPEAWGRRQL